MNRASSDAAPHGFAGRTRWFHWAILGVLLVLAGLIRFDRIGQESLWPDEFWSSLYLATGRGNMVFDLPVGVLLDPPPHTTLRGAPSWPHIWTGLGSVVHPPLYMIVLRWWMDIFGESDTATRGFSAVMSLIGIIVLFDTVRRTSGPATGLIAAALMTLAISQIDQSQEARPYTFLALMGLLTCRAMLEIEWHGATAGRLVLLGAAVFATAMTHYFAAGALLGLGVYALLRFRGRTRMRVVVSMIVPVLLMIAAWFPWFWQQHGQLSGQGEWSYNKAATVPMVLLRSLFVPAMHMYFTLSWGLVIALAVIAYALPLVFLRRRPQLLIWWCWMVGTVVSVTLYDAVSHSWLIGYTKYTFILTPALYVLLAEPLPWPGWRGWVVPAILVASVAVYANERWRDGPGAREDWRSVALAANHAAPHDPLIFYPSAFWGSPAFWFMAFDHYVPDSQRPIMMLKGPADQSALRQLAKYPRVWLIGPDPLRDGGTILPGYSGRWVKGYPLSGGVEEMVREFPATSPARSPATRP
jgi:uncharacterized membrane protein